MKKLLTLLLLIPVLASAQFTPGTNVAGQIQRNSISGWIRYLQGANESRLALYSDLATATDTTVLRTVANSYSLAGMQTKLNNYVTLGTIQTITAAKTFTLTTRFGTGTDNLQISPSGSTYTGSGSTSSSWNPTSFSVSDISGAASIGTTNFRLTSSGSNSDIVRGIVTGSRQLRLGDTTGTAAITVSPNFLGVPKAPTASPGTNTTQLATTAFVTNAVSSTVASQAAYTIDNTNNNYYLGYHAANTATNQTFKTGSKDPMFNASTGLLTVTDVLATGNNGFTSNLQMMINRPSTSVPATFYYNTNGTTDWRAGTPTGASSYDIFNGGTSTNALSINKTTNAFTFGGSLLSPTLVTPTLGVASATSLAASGGISGSSGMFSTGSYTTNGVTTVSSNGTTGPHVVGNTDASNLSVVNAGAGRVLLGSGGIVLQQSPATTIGVSRTWTDHVTVGTSGSVRFNTYGAGQLYTDALGNISAVSDSTYKEKFKPYTRGLDALRSLKPKSYNHNIKSGLDRSHRYVSLIAQDVKKSIPEAVFDVEKGKPLTVQDRVILATMVNAINELRERLEKAEAEIKLLKSQ